MQNEGNLGNEKNEENEENEIKNFNLILISDSQSSLEALENFIEKKQIDNININIINKEIGEINESLINIAKITESSFVLFNVKINQHTEKELNNKKIK